MQDVAFGYEPRSSTILMIRLDPSSFAPCVCKDFDFNQRVMNRKDCDEIFKMLSCVGNADGGMSNCECGISHPRTRIPKAWAEVYRVSHNH